MAKLEMWEINTGLILTRRLLIKQKQRKKSTTAIKNKHVFCDIGIHLSNTTSRALTMATTQTFSIISLFEI